MNFAAKPENEKYFHLYINSHDCILPKSKILSIYLMRLSTKNIEVFRLL